jgi:hypothetical protein
VIAKSTPGSKVTSRLRPGWPVPAQGAPSRLPPHALWAPRFVSTSPRPAGGFEGATTQATSRDGAREPRQAPPGQARNHE